MAAYQGENAAVAKGWTFKPGFLYTQVRAISARINQNFDGWPSEELKKSYKTFIGKPVFVNHQNFDPSKARGKVVAARYVEAGDDKYIEVIQEVDAMRFPKLAREIKEGGMDSVSMGVEAGFTICSYCGNKAVDVPEFCDHVKYHKGSTLQKRNTKTGAVEDVLVYEKCFKLGFFELSFVFDPADETAVVNRVIAANHRHGTGETSNEPPALSATSPGTDSYADSTEPPKMKNPLGLMGGGSAAAEKFNPVDIGAGLLENMGEHAVHSVAEPAHGGTSPAAPHPVAAPEAPKLPEAPSLPESSISKTHSLAKLERRIDRLAAEPAPPPNVIILPDMMTPEMPTGMMPQASYRGAGSGWNDFHELDMHRFPDHWVPAQRPAPQHKSQGEFDSTPTGAPGAPKSSPAKGYVTDLGHGYHRPIAAIEAAIDLLAYSHVPAKKPAEPKAKGKKHWYDIFKDDGPHDPHDPRNDPWYTFANHHLAYGEVEALERQINDLSRLPERAAARGTVAEGSVRSLLRQGVEDGGHGGSERYSSAAQASAGSGDSQAAHRHQANGAQQRLRGTEDRQRSGQSGPEQLGLRTRLGHGATPGPQAAAWGGSAPQKQAARRQPLGELGAMDDFSTGGWPSGGLDRLGGGAPSGRRVGSTRLSYGECEAPEDVDTLRNEEEDDFEDDFKHYVQSPKELRGPDLDQTKRLDRAQEDEGLDADRRAESVEDVSGPPQGGNVMASRNARRARRRTQRYAEGPPMDPSMLGGDPSLGGPPPGATLARW